MKRYLPGLAMIGAIAGGGFALAQAPANTSPSQTAPLAGPPGPRRGDGPGPWGGGMMGGWGMMGGGMGPGACPMWGGATTKVDVKKIANGVTITLTSPDAATATRLQKMAEAMRLMHEAEAPQ